MNTLTPIEALLKLQELKGAGGGVGFHWSSKLSNDPPVQTPDFLLLSEDAWLPLSAGRATQLLAELHRETVAGHRLHGVALKALAVASANDDVLFQHSENPERFSVVHLTWKQGPEPNPMWPAIEFDGTWPELVADQQRFLGWLNRPGNAN